MPAISLASCGTDSGKPGLSASSSSGGGSAKPGLSVTPTAGSPTTTFSLSFTAPASSGVTAHSRLGYTLGLTGPTKAGCIDARSVQVPAVTKGEPVPITLDPAQLGGTWCSGTYTARVVELVTPVCTTGMLCPQFVRLVGTVGTATFRIEPAS